MKRYLIIIACLLMTLAASSPLFAQRVDENVAVPFSRTPYQVSAASAYMGYSIRTDRWRYTEWDGGKRGAELYDEVADPQETRNLVADPQHRKVVDDLQRRLRRVSAR